MGYYIFSYGIKSDEIKSKFGSKDQEALQKIQSTSTYNGYKDFLPDGYHTTPKKAIEDIINGEVFDKNCGFSYGYAMICICKGLGIELPHSPEIKVGFETDSIDKYLEEDFDLSGWTLQGLLFDSFKPFQIPRIDDFPLIGMVPNDYLENLKTSFGHIEISEEDILKLEEEDFEKGMAYRHIKEFVENVDFCIENKLDIVSFCH